jgi:DNA-binding transcriptional LysR family regulator
MIMRADDLLILLEVARCGSLAAAGTALGLNHATVSRRLSSLEHELGEPVLIRGAAGCEVTDLGRSLLESSERIEGAMADVYRRSRTLDGVRQLSGVVRVAAPEGLATVFIAPVFARFQREHPAVALELVTTPRLPVQGTGADIEIGIGAPLASRNDVEVLTEYELGLYASEDYLASRGTPRSAADLSEHCLIYYIDTLLRLEDADLNTVHDIIPGRKVQVGSTSIFIHLTVAASGGGIALLPAFIAGQRPELRQVLAETTTFTPRFLAALAPERLRRPAAIMVMEEIRREVMRRRDELLPRRAHSPRA